VLESWASLKKQAIALSEQINKDYHLE